MRNLTTVDVLVIGGSGLLGRELAQQARRAGAHVAATYHRHRPGTAGADWYPLDIRHGDDVAALVERTRPAAIVNAASAPGDWATTADGAMYVAAAAAAVGARLVQVSSDACAPGMARRAPSSFAWTAP